MATALSEGASSSTREFLEHEAWCDTDNTPADTDDELKAIFTEMSKLANERSGESIGTAIAEEIDDIELLLKKAQDLALESREAATTAKTPPGSIEKHSMEGVVRTDSRVPQIKITKAKDVDKTKKTEWNTSTVDCKDSAIVKLASKEHIKNDRPKSSVRPFSAGGNDPKRNKNTYNNSPKKTLASKNEQLSEELKDIKEHMNKLELQNVKLTEDNKIYRCKLNEVTEQKQILELKLSECEKFMNRMGNEYENKKFEMAAIKDNESKLAGDLIKERNERKNLSIQRDRDKSTIQDLQRQCKEMELILRRKHPDSVSALIVASKSSTIDDNKRKLLEERVMRLENELADKEKNFQGVLTNLQEKFSDMKHKYEAHIIDVERQLMEDRKVNTELKNKINKTNLLDACVQTGTKLATQSVTTQTFLKNTERLSSAVSRLSQNSSIIFSKLREDSYLIATIKGLQTELTVKQRTISKINRETEELRKSLRNMQKEKEGAMTPLIVLPADTASGSPARDEIPDLTCEQPAGVILHNFNPQKKTTVTKQTKSTDNLLARINTEMETELTELRRQMNIITMDRDSLMQSLKRTGEEFILLKKKRIQDLHTLQLSHEKELMEMNMQLYPLQEEIQILNRTVEILQSKLKLTDEQLHKIKQANDVLKVKINGQDFQAGGDNATLKARSEVLKKRFEAY